MIKSEKRFKELAEILNKGKSLFISSAIKSLREEEPFEGAVGLLVEFYNEASGISGLRAVEDFLNDIKDKSVCPEVIAEIRKPWKSNTISMLVASCWQSGLDYSEYIEDMVKIFLEGDIATAVECMTVIEESVKNCSRKRKDKIIRIIGNGPLSYTHEKNALTLELISILER